MLVTLTNLYGVILLIIMLQIVCSLNRALTKIDRSEQCPKFYFFDGLPCPYNTKCVSDPTDEKSRTEDTTRTAYFNLLAQFL